jgi:hypothetical protein
MMNPENHFRLLGQSGISLPEWYVLSLIGKWPFPHNQVCKTVASHSEQDLRGPVTKMNCEAALTACITKHWLRIIDTSSLKAIRSFVRNSNLGGPVYGYPSIGDVDFTPEGAILYQNLYRQLYRRSLEARHGYPREIAAGKFRYYYQRRKAVLGAISDWKQQETLLSVGRIVPIGPWCVYWWKRFPKGYGVDVEFKASL